MVCVCVVKWLCVLLCVRVVWLCWIVILYEVYLVVLWCWCVLLVIRCVVLHGVCCAFVFVFAYVL